MSSHDRFEPKLRVASSGFEGSGYKLPTRGGVVVPGVTTVLGIIDKPGVVQWAVDNTAAYAAANVDQLLTRSEGQGFGFLRWYYKRMKEEHFDDPTIDIRDYSNGVLMDRAELGTITHDWVASNVLDEFEPDLPRAEAVQMADLFLDWREQHEIRPRVVEGTVVGQSEDGLPFAGTLDHLWDVRCLHENPCLGREGWVTTLIDAKTSRRTQHVHLAQLAALGASPTLMVETDENDPDGVLYDTKKWGKTYWKEDVLPDFSDYAILALRPDDYDWNGKFVPGFVKLKHVSQEHIDAGWEMFQGALRARHAQKALKKLTEV